MVNIAIDFSLNQQLQADTKIVKEYYVLLGAKFTG